MICHFSSSTARKSRRSDFSFCKYRKKRKPPIILASLGCFFAHLSYSPRTASLASSFFMLAMPTETLTVPLTVTEPKVWGLPRLCLTNRPDSFLIKPRAHFFSGLEVRNDFLCDLHFSAGHGIASLARSANLG